MKTQIKLTWFEKLLAAIVVLVFTIQLFIFIFFASVFIQIYLTVML